MSTTGGNWKEFWLEASKQGGGDLNLIEFHLRNGVDPNFQHPEMMSTALCEAVGAGNVQIVQFLLKYQDKDGKLAVDPTIPSAYENQTPLEMAMELQHHAMIDMILEALPLDKYAEESKYCQRILVSVPTTNVPYSDYATNIIEQVLRLGHMVISAASSKTIKMQEDSNGSSLQTKYEKETGNAKFWSVSSFNEVPSLLASSSDSSKVTLAKIDTWLCFLLAGEKKPNNGSFLDLIDSEFIQPSRSFSTEYTAPNQVWLVLPSTLLATAYDKQQLIWFLQRCQTRTAMQKSAFLVNAMIIPCSWWDTLWRGGSSSWIDNEAMGRLLKLNEDDIAIGGKIYNHKLEQMPCWANMPAVTDPKTVCQWEALLSKS